jgi:hypothetical protein
MIQDSIACYREETFDSTCSRDHPGSAVLAHYERRNPAEERTLGSRSDQHDHWRLTHCETLGLHAAGPSFLKRGVYGFWRVTCASITCCCQS